MTRPFAGAAAGDVALVDAGTGASLTYADLEREVARRAARLRSLAAGRLAFLAAPNSVEAVLAYLAALEGGVPLVLVPPSAAPLHRLAAAYRPGVILLGEGVTPPDGFAHVAWDDGLAAFTDWSAPVPEIHVDLALLLTTSGTTGSPKLVRLGRRQLEANARSIATYLALGPCERAPTSLPMTYSYGLSVVNSHLAAGAALVVTARSFLSREFWDEFDRRGSTSFAGVPYAYETLARLRFEPARHPTLSSMTQAGGRLADDLLRAFDAKCRAAGARFHAMYGQTEATARMAHVPPGEFASLAGTVGRPIPGGSLRLAADGELVYEGPNVMFGYAETPADLARGDDLGGVLATGDLAEPAGASFRIVGRRARFAKLAGARVSLDDVERDVAAAHGVRAACVETTGAIAVTVESGDAALADAVRDRLADRLGVPPSMLLVRALAALPVTPSGKTDYGALRP